VQGSARNDLQVCRSRFFLSSFYLLHFYFQSSLNLFWIQHYWFISMRLSPNSSMHRESPLWPRRCMPFHMQEMKKWLRRSPLHFRSSLPSGNDGWWFWLYGLPLPAVCWPSLPENIFLKSAGRMNSLIITWVYFHFRADMRAYPLLSTDCWLTILFVKPNRWRFSTGFYTAPLFLFSWSGSAEFICAYIFSVTSSADIFSDRFGYCWQ